MIYILSWLLWSVAAMAVSEYLIHKYLMHKRLFKHRWLSWIFTDHTIEHHKHERYDINVDLPFYFHLIVGAPLFILFAIYSWTAFVCLFLVTLHHSIYWSKLHRATHDLENNWTENFPNGRFYYQMRRHHLMHHRYPNKNFGVVYPITDWIFGSMI